MFVHICMLTLVYELLITQLHIYSMNFINVLSHYRCIRYLVFPALFPNISMIFIDKCVLHLSYKFFIMVAYTIVQAHVTYATLKIALNIQVIVANKHCLYLFACWHRFMYFVLQGLPIFSINLINALSFNCYMCYQIIHKLFCVSL